MTGDAEAADWLSLEEALGRILERCAPMGEESVSLEEALGRTLAEPVHARTDQPPWDNSAMDGFAIRAPDVEGANPATPVRLPISDDIPAGAFPSGPLRPGTAARVMTGAPVPEGATGVIRVEHTDGGEGASVEIREASDARRNIRRTGEDVRRGARLLEPGRALGPAAIGALALTGRGRARVGRRPRVALLANGDELATLEEFEEVLAGRKIVNTNSHTLAAQVRLAGAEPVDLGIARDDPEDIRARIAGPVSWDALVSTAGVSVGERDHVKTVLRDLGLERSFWRVRVRPGSALLFGILDGRPVWGVPGNPVSAMVAFQVFVVPALRKMTGRAVPRPPGTRVRVEEDIESAEDLTHFFRVRVDRSGAGLPRARLTGPQGSGILTSMVQADALLQVPEGRARLAAGSEATALPLPG